MLRLDTQYRMHTEIADWPARYFYGGKLSHSAPVVPGVPVCPYLVCQVTGDTQVTSEGGCWNKLEEKVVMAGVEAVKNIVGEDMSIGEL